jgi:hypothetical protein
VELQPYPVKKKIVEKLQKKKKKGRPRPKLGCGAKEREREICIHIRPTVDYPCMTMHIPQIEQGRIGK